VEKMGGEIEVTSTLNNGSVFTVDLPFEAVEGSPQITERHVRPRDVSNVLIACDHETDGQLVGKMLKSIGITVAVLDRRMALEMLQAGEGGCFDALITDAVEAPRLAQDLLRATEKQSGKPVKGMMLIEATDRRDYEDLRDKGFGVYVTRPVRHISLAHQLDNAVPMSVLALPEDNQDGFEPRTVAEPVVEEFGVPVCQSESRQVTEPRKARILLAEDNDINALLGCRLLQHMGYEVVHVTDGQLAVQAVKKSMVDDQFDVVLMDLQMPHMDGLEATIEIRAFEKQMGSQQSPLPIVALTANAFADVQAECYAVGMSAYLAKPFARDELKEIIENSLAGKALMAS
jgi:CheY-like chemotaxis protein